MYDALAVFKPRVQRSAQFFLALHVHFNGSDRQLDVVFGKPVKARPRCDRKELPIDAQMRETLALCPLREIGVEPLAVDHERREHRRVLAFAFAHHTRCNRVQRLWLNRHVTGRAILRPELHPQEAQEVINLGQRGDR